MTYYLVLFEEEITCEYGFKHIVPSVIARIKTMDKAAKLAEIFHGAVEEEIEEEVYV